MVALDYVEDVHPLPPAGRTLADGSPDATNRLWKLHTDELLHCLRGHQYNVKPVAISADCTWLVSTSLDTTVKKQIWDVESGREQLCLLGHDGSVFCAQFLPASGYVVSGGGDHTVRVWEALACALLRFHIRRGLVLCNGIRE